MPELAWICATCGVQAGASAQPPEICAICADPRQYVPTAGQRWTTMDALAATHRNSFQNHEPNLTGIGSEPHFAIGQRALLIRTPNGNVLWDCISLLDAATRDIVAALGGIAAIAISHPHFHATMVDWSRAFGDAPIYVHAADRAAVARPDPAIRFWSGETNQILDGVTLINTGGHFEGAAVLHWQGGVDRRGALLTADIASVAADTRYVSFLRSFPNYIPLGSTSVERIAAALEPYDFERIYGGWWHSVIARDAKAALARSVARYLAAIDGRYP